MKMKPRSSMKMLESLLPLSDSTDQHQLTTESTSFKYHRIIFYMSRKQYNHEIIFILDD